MPSADADVEAIEAILQFLKPYRLEASRIQVGRITLDLLPRSQLDDNERGETRVPLDASGGRLRS